ncbi:TonB-dependent receptor [Pararhodospirillum oryzae]|uniref:Ligand-gated channel n=1 Tax=Pararhodospirillum oryzae TaxID=478448 RepID=A0A512H6D8_9PROT|nr:TonB-dependent receptor [Pararhodospirillum oryzae]GEO81029.1 ligand-gated channel [Pararhodospirillum oryzae]
MALAPRSTPPCPPETGVAPVPSARSLAVGGSSRLGGGTLIACALLAPPALAQSDSAPAADAVPEVVVTAPADTTPALTGRAEDGYRKETATVGPLGPRKLLDLPYSVNSVSSDLIENTRAHTLADVIRHFPSAQIEARGGVDVGRPQTRGFQADIVQNTRMNGMNVFAVTPYPMEQLETVEVLYGLSGALYGPAAPAGTFNYILKRPTEERLNKATLGYDSNGIFTSHADAGGQVAGLGYRLNGLWGSGESYTETSHLTRWLVSGAFDVPLGDDTKLELNASRYRHDSKGFPGSFSYSQTTELPDPVDATKVGLGQEFAGQQTQTDTASGTLKHHFSDDWSATVGLLRQSATRNLKGLSNALQADGNTYRSSVSTNMTGTVLLYSTQAALNGRVHTWDVTHDLMVGTNGYWQRGYNPLKTGSWTLGTASLSSPREFNEPTWIDLGPTYKSGDNRVLSVTVGDTITFNKYWSLMGAVSHSWLDGESYNSSGVETSSYDASGFSPTVSLMFKPESNATIYFTYADSLQKGDQAPTSGVANAGEILSPYRSRQVEAGLKMTVGEVDLSTALFRIERPFAYTGADNVFREQGQQVNYGWELGARGKVWDDLTLIGGLTLLDAKLTDTGKAATEDKQVVGVPTVQANLYAEYQVPPVPGLALDMNVHYTGERAANDTNSTWAAGYTTVDLGARYNSDIMGKNVTWRAGVNNLFDEDYWVSVFPSSINGTNAGSPSAFLGTPRTFWASMSIAF